VAFAWRDRRTVGPNSRAEFPEKKECAASERRCKKDCPRPRPQREHRNGKCPVERRPHNRVFRQPRPVPAAPGKMAGVLESAEWRRPRDVPSWHVFSSVSASTTRSSRATSGFCLWPSAKVLCRRGSPPGVLGSSVPEAPTTIRRTLQRRSQRAHRGGDAAQEALAACEQLQERRAGRSARALQGNPSLAWSSAAVRGSARATSTSWEGCWVSVFDLPSLIVDRAEPMCGRTLVKTAGQQRRTRASRELSAIAGVWCRIGSRVDRHTDRAFHAGWPHSVAASLRIRSPVGSSGPRGGPGAFVHTLKPPAAEWFHPLG